MTELFGNFDSLKAETALREIVAYLPWLAGAILLLVIGWIVARLMRAATLRLGAGLNAFLARFRRRGAAGRPLKLSPALLKLIGNVVFWLVLLVTIALAARLARLDLFTTWLDRIVAYLPSLLAGGLILLVGYLVSTAARDLVTTALDSAGSEQSDFFGFLAQGAIFLAALVIGLDQIGVDVTMLTILFAVIVGGLLLCLALAFGLGARSFVANLIGAHQLRAHLAPGQHARIGEHEGQVIELTPTTVILATDHGRVTIPAKLFQEEVTVIAGAGDHE